MAKEPERANSSFLKPQPKDTSPGHFYISVIKSSFRIAGCIAGALAASNNPVGAIMIISLSFGFAEALGIAEELA